MSYKVLLVEDDATTADYITKGLVEEGFTVDRADNGRDGLFLATEAAHDAIILDRMLPGMDGMAVLAALRAAGIETPVIILSALATADERVKGLTGGSDDYLAKPFAFAELLARLRIILRRGGGQAAETRLSCGGLEVDLLSRKVKRGSRTIDLQPREFRLLDYLLRHQGEVVTRTMLLEGVWDYHFDPGTNVIDVHISRLRRKVDEEGESPLIHTIRGAGYRLSEQG
ncbi:MULTISPECIES: winged helix-turn-helix domain-containing protein [Sphingobium]|jgi:two-component system OmpR family response regulator|uniref:Response regulator n=1 Tax=Sphingobium limneticum TaxID=1007511 RepID=A0A5J5HVD0_9SPHN|nr:MULTISPECIES: winged helix-turn-helix domain-containing protein [Sphingobium]MBU0930479.1 winged helix-turn-helix domain-containing protein [Alphaproteobacteria bacterium]KAA9011699.1 response regulator [Sphingobium limneticum]KAA9013531.1 response regulator [Sphingobium limneticum]KAA9026593.1 response regulator [Sphingobium limneticum]BBD02420.1 two-component system, OmpR family, response regulator [Sphingobium sp. YG1]